MHIKIQGLEDKTQQELAENIDPIEIALEISSERSLHCGREDDLARGIKRWKRFLKQQIPSQAEDDDLVSRLIV